MPLEIRYANVSADQTEVFNDFEGEIKQFTYGIGGFSISYPHHGHAMQSFGISIDAHQSTSEIKVKPSVTFEDKHGNKYDDANVTIVVFAWTGTEGAETVALGNLAGLDPSASGKEIKEDSQIVGYNTFLSGFQLSYDKGDHDTQTVYVKTTAAKKGNDGITVSVKADMHDKNDHDVDTKTVDVGYMIVFDESDNFVTSFGSQGEKEFSFGGTTINLPVQEAQVPSDFTPAGDKEAAFTLSAFYYSYGGGHDHHLNSISAGFYNDFNDPIGFFEPDSNKTDFYWLIDKTFEDYDDHSYKDESHTMNAVILGKHDEDPNGGGEETD